MQTNRKLSPGPWIVLEPYTNSSVFPIAYQQGEAFYIFAEVNSQGGTPEQCRANADCLAAARELLEACRKVCRDLEYAYGGQGQMPAMEAKIYDAARKAIAKAEGQR